MINLLPPGIKEEIAYSKRNAVVLHFVSIVVLAVLVLGAAFGGSYIYLQNRIDAAQKATGEKQTVIDSYKGLEGKVKTVNDRLATIKTIQAGQSKYSSLLADLARVMPPGAVLNSLSLTGDDKKPVSLSATATSYQAALGLRDALASSSRVAGVDVQSISQTGGSYNVEMVLSFKPGQAK